jgi:transcriptional regulator with XRE-family HTH domain
MKGLTKMGIKNNIKIIREIYGLSQEDLAKIAGVTDKAVSTWENGMREPRMGVLNKIANHFGIKKSNLIEDGGLDDFKSPLQSNFKIGNKPKEVPVVVFTQEDVDLISRFRNLPPIAQQTVLTLISSLEEMNKTQNEQAAKKEVG